MEKFKLIIIAAIAKNNTIGDKGNLIWHIPEDLKLFKRKTMGFPIIMGRKTFESFPAPLPGRVHIVISSNHKENSTNVIWAQSVEEAIEKAKEINPQKAYIIGGGKIYAQTINLADILEITQLNKDFMGDTKFPTIDNKKFRLKKSEKLEIGKDFDAYLNTYFKI